MAEGGRRPLQGWSGCMLFLGLVVWGLRIGAEGGARDPGQLMRLEGSEDS